ncbi:MAG: DMT family transporter [Betaproteobacteria bacterium]
MVSVFAASSGAAHGARFAQGMALAVVGALGFAGKAILAKLMYRHGVDAVTVVAWRMLLALPLFVAMAWWGARGAPALTRRDAVTIVALGFSGYYLSSMLDFYGLMYITASLERLILYLGPTFVMVLAVVVLKKRVTLRQWLAAGISYAGVLVVFGHELLAPSVPAVGNAGAHTAASTPSGAAATVLGAALVLGSAVSYSGYLLASGEVVERLGSLRLTGLASSVACVFCLLHFAAVHPLSVMVVPEPVMWMSLLNALLCTVMPVLAVMMAIERIGPALSSQVGMVGPLATVALGVYLLGEPFTVWILAGTVLVLLGVGLLARWR